MFLSILKTLKKNAACNLFPAHLQVSVQVQRTTFSRSILVANEMYIGNDFPIVLFVQYELIRKNSLI